MKTKLFATYRNGILIPETKLNLEDNSKVEVILEDEIYRAFSLAGEDSDVEDYLIAQREILKNE